MRVIQLFLPKHKNLEKLLSCVLETPIKGDKRSAVLWYRTSVLYCIKTLQVPGDMEYVTGREIWGAIVT